MKAVILAGGFGSRLSEETTRTPKAMLYIGDRPILWHVMKIYSHYGIRDFIICLGYKGYAIKEYFHSYLLHSSDAIVDLEKNSVEYLNSQAESWKIALVDTGMDSLTGDRVRRVQHLVGNETFMVTYADGVGEIDISALIRDHKNSGKVGTLTAVQPPGRFGAVELDSNNEVLRFEEKPRGDNAWINGGFYVFEPHVFDYLKGAQISLECHTLAKLAQDQQLHAYRHHGFWKPMDTLRDMTELQNLWASGQAPWRKWL